MSGEACLPKINIKFVVKEIIDLFYCQTCFFYDIRITVVKEVIYANTSPNYSNGRSDFGHCMFRAQSQAFYR